MIKVKFLKDHTVHKKGDVVNMNKGEANYLHRMGVIELAFDEEDCGCGGAEVAITSEGKVVEASKPIEAQEQATEDEAPEEKTTKKSTKKRK